MYTYTLFFHSFFRWLVLISLLMAIGSSIHGLITARIYSKTDKLLRIAVNTICHTQLIIGFVLYFALSPITGFFIKNGAGGNDEIRFFGMYHLALMLGSIVVATIGSALSKKAVSDTQKFKTIAIWFSFALILILSAIPWYRPLFRNL
ncbi:hypothetical protein C0V77_06030 [Emticicia sp. TH156]|nr:hypothetical protein C0V77_06030 [Emticicia sp. TH156]